MSLPNGDADDEGLTGKRQDEGQSEYGRDNSGVGWAGEHVDYDSVIGEYSDRAYEGLENGASPTGMEDVIKEYFSSFE